MSSTARQLIFWIFVLTGAIFLYKFAGGKILSLSDVMLETLKMLALIFLGTLAVLLAVSALALLVRKYKPSLTDAEEIRLRTLKTLLDNLTGDATELKLSSPKAFIQKAIVIATVFFNARVLSSFIKTVTHEQDLKDKRVDPTVVALMLEGIVKNYAAAYTCLSTSIVIVIFSDMLLGVQFRVEVLVILTLLMALLFINQTVLEYRISRGLYGTNEYEVRELLKFVLKHSENTKSNGGKGLKDLQLFPTPNKASASDNVTDVSGVTGAKA